MKKIISLLLIISNFFVVLQIPCYSYDESEYYATSENAYTEDYSNYDLPFQTPTYQIVIPINASAQATADAHVKSTCKSFSSSSGSTSAKTWLILAAVLFLAYKLKIFNPLSLFKQNNVEQFKEAEKQPQEDEIQPQKPGLFNKFTNYFTGALADLSARLTLQGLIDFFFPINPVK